jgi:hypothetical protein
MKPNPLDSGYGLEAGRPKDEGARADAHGSTVGNPKRTDDELTTRPTLAA